MPQACGIMWQPPPAELNLSETLQSREPSRHFGKSEDVPVRPEPRLPAKSEASASWYAAGARLA